jgi:small redox-active disulfide protein 2
MLDIKILGPGCPKCKTTYNNTIEAVKQLGIEAIVTKVEDIMEIMKYNVLSTPVLMINEVAKIKGRTADVSEIKKLLSNLETC